MSYNQQEFDAAFDRYWKAYHPTIESSHETTEPEQGVFGDFVDAAQAGMAQGWGGLMESMGQLFDTDAFNGMRDQAQAFEREQYSQMSEQGRDALNQQIFGKDENGHYQFGEGATNWRTWVLSAGQMLGQQADMIIPAGLAVKGTRLAITGAAKLAGKQIAKEALKKGMPAKAANFLGMATAGVMVGGGMSANQARDEVMNLSGEQLNATPEFQQAYWEMRDNPENSQYSDEEIYQGAKNHVAEMAASKVWHDPRLMAANAVGEGVGGWLGGMGVLGAGKTLKSAALKGAATEGITEFGQGATERRVTNEAVQQYGDTNLDVNQDVILSGLNEGALAMLPGAGGGMVNRVVERNNPQQQAIENPITGNEKLDTQMHSTSNALNEQMAQTDDVVDQVVKHRQSTSLSHTQVEPGVNTLDDQQRELYASYDGMANEQLQERLETASEEEAKVILTRINDNQQTATEQPNDESVDVSATVDLDVPTYLRQHDRGYENVIGDIGQDIPKTTSPSAVDLIQSQMADSAQVPEEEHAAIAPVSDITDMAPAQDLAESTVPIEEPSTEQQFTNADNAQTKAPQQHIQYKANGQPFPTEKLAIASKWYRDPLKEGKQVDVVPVEGGYAVQVTTPPPNQAITESIQQAPSDEGVSVSEVPQNPGVAQEHIETDTESVEQQQEEDSKKEDRNYKEVMFSRESVKDKELADNFTKEELEFAVKAFEQEYNGNIGIEFKSYQKQEDAFGNDFSIETHGPVSGAYFPSQKLIVMFADSIAHDARREAATLSKVRAANQNKSNRPDSGGRGSDELGAVRPTPVHQKDLLREFTRTIRHETIGHYGFNTFKPDDKKALLEKIISTRQDKQFSKLWEHVDKSYPALSEMMKAEEVFAKAAEKKPGSVGEAWNRILAFFNKLLRKTGLSKSTLGHRELHELIRKIDTGIKDGTRKQQTFPKTDTAQFSRTGHSESKPTGKGMPKKQADLIVKQWLRQYKGGARVAVKVVQTQAEAEAMLGITDSGTIHAFYLNNEAVLVADNISAAKELRSKLRHEVLVHHGLAAVVGDVEYDNILMKVYSGKNSKYLRDVWDKIEASYSDKPIETQVEEVLAAIAEVERSKLGQWYDRVVAAIAKALRKVGLMSNSDVTQAEMRAIVQTLADRVKAANAWDPNSSNSDATVGEGKLSRAKFSRVPENAAVVHGKPIQSSTFKEMRLKVKAKGFEFAGRTYRNKDSGHLIYVGKSGVKHTISGASEDLLSSVAFLPELLKSATYLGSKPDQKGNHSVKAHHYYGVKFEINGRIKDVVIDAREMEDGKYYYDHSFERSQASGGSGSGPHLRAQGPIYPGGGAEATNSIADGDGNTNKSKNLEQRHIRELQLPNGSTDRGSNESVAGGTPSNNSKSAGTKKDEPKFSRSSDTFTQALNKARAAAKSQTNPETSITDGGFAVPAETLISVAVRKMADKFKVLKDVQANIIAAGGKVDDANNAYLAEELFHGKAENDLRLMRDSFVKPLADKMASYGISQKELDHFLIARHAEERNQHIASINPDMPDGGSGMKTADAHRALDAIKKSGKQKQYKELAQIVYAMLQKQRDVLKSSGLEGESVIGAWESTYKYYVPLKGIAKDEPASPRTGKGFAIGGKESKRAMGRKSLSESPTSHAIIDLTEKLVRARKNEVGNVLLKLIQDNPSDDYWQVFTSDDPDTAAQVVERVNPETGIKEEVVKEMPVPMAMMGDFYFPTKKDGKTYYIRLHDERLMKAMKNIGPDTSNILIRTLATVNRFLSAVNTSYNPEFVVGNFARDIQTAVLNLSAEQTRKDGKIKGEKIVKQVIMDVPTSMRAVYASLRGKELNGKAAKWQQHYEEFMEDGAKTGWFDMKDIDAQAKELERMTEMANGTVKGKLYKGFDAVTGAVENANMAIENAVRLSAYVNARQAGISRKKAASLAKNMTVNFNRRGEMGTTLNAMYMFSNASIQGSANFVRTMYGLNGDGKLKWQNLNNGQKIAVGAMVGSFALAAMNRAGAGEDDDGVNWYDKVPDYVKERNFVIMKSFLGGEQDGSYWKVPMPYGYNLFSVIGTSMEAVAAGSKTTANGAGDIVTAALGSFSPIGMQESKTVSGFILKNALPTILKPFAEVGLNENFMGGQIYNESFPFGTPKPDSSLGRRGTPEQYMKFAQWLNEKTGGSAYRSGGIDINPDVMKYVVNYLGGGALRFATDKAPGLGSALMGNDVEDRNIAFWSRISGKVMPYEDQTKFYDRRTELLQLRDELKASFGEDRNKLYQQHKGELGLLPLLKASEKQLKALRKRRDVIYQSSTTTAEKDLRLKNMERQMKKVIDRFNKRYEELAN